MLRLGKLYTSYIKENENQIVKYQAINWNAMVILEMN